jgi:hypothetical protein
MIETAVEQANIFSSSRFEKGLEEGYRVDLNRRKFRQRSGANYPRELILLNPGYPWTNSAHCEMRCKRPSFRIETQVTGAIFN